MHIDVVCLYDEGLKIFFFILSIVFYKYIITCSIVFDI